jgi:alkanesulfonate monooxygenase SsuD/methylene tetrahydromethanopterin reductase-like flavin-dependent oxidoreductase (luciferase family)
VRVGVVILPEQRWRDAAAVWRRAEELGFAHAWTYDHIAWSVLHDSEWFGAVPTLAAAALVTTRIRLGTLVASPNFRHPVPFAREVSALDDLSDGRLTLGIGAGGVGWDATILGQEPWLPAERSARFVEFVALLDRLLREPVTTTHGRYYSAVDVHNEPGCVQRPRVPFAIAATGPKAMRVVAEHGAAWVTNGARDHSGPPLDATAGGRVVREQLGRLEDACAAVGRDPASVDRIVLTGPRLDSGLGSPAMFDDVKGAYAAIGVTDLVVHWPRPSEPFAGDPSSLERISLT